MTRAIEELGQFRQYSDWATDRRTGEMSFIPGKDK